MAYQAGELATVTYPVNIPVSYSYDPEGEPTTVSFGGNPWCNHGIYSPTAYIENKYYTARGEQYLDYTTDCTPPSSRSQINHKNMDSTIPFFQKVSLNGFMLPNYHTVWSSQGGSGIVSDALITSVGSSGLRQPGYLEGNTFDALGRETKQAQAKNPGGCKGSLNRSFDAENRIAGTRFSTYQFGAAPDCNQALWGGASGSSSYLWGPNGHPALVSGAGVKPSPATETLHWDGDQLLFTSDSHGVVDDIKVGLLADTSPGGGFTILDRDPSGVAIGIHYANAGAAQLTGASDPFGAACNDSGSSEACLVLPGYISQPTSDGIWDHISVIQGVRAYDPVGSTWTSPDAYAGEVHDPLSQKPYVWNRNNPVLYSDPTGYCSDPGGRGARVCMDYFIPGADAAGLRGDNRGFNGNLKTDTFRVRINLDFQDHGRSSISVADSHRSSDGADVGKGHDNGSSITWHGSSADVHVNASCGPCVGGALSPFTIRGDITVSSSKNGSVDVSGTRSDFPALEIFQYLDGSVQQIYQGDASGFGILGLPFTTSVRPSPVTK